MSVLTSYGYTIAVDFPNHKISPDRLTKEIRSSSIVTALSHIDTNETTCQVWFKEALSATDNTTLDSLVSVHNGELLEKNTLQTVRVREEDFNTGGHFQAHSVQIDVLDTVGWYEQEISWPYPISLLTAEFVGCPERKNDEGQVLVGPETVIGVLTADANVGDNVFNVSQTVIDNASVGYSYDINGDVLGKCISIDEENLTITTENPCNANHLVASPSYVRQTVYMAERIVIDESGVFVVANSKIGGAHIPANTVLRFRYNNKSGTAKKFNVLLEYLY